MKKVIFTLLLLFLCQSNMPMNRSVVLAASGTGIRHLIGRLDLNRRGITAILGRDYSTIHGKKTDNNDKENKQDLKESNQELSQELKELSGLYECSNCKLGLNCPTVKSAKRLATLTNQIDPSQRQVKLADVFQATKSLAAGSFFALHFINHPELISGLISSVFLHRGISCLLKANEAWRLGNSLRHNISFPRLMYGSRLLLGGSMVGLGCYGASLGSGDGSLVVLIVAGALIFPHENFNKLRQSNKCYETQDKLRKIAADLNKKLDSQEMQRVQILQHKQTKINGLPDKTMGLNSNKSVQDISSMSPLQRKSLYDEFAGAYHPVNNSDDKAAEKLSK